MPDWLTYVLSSVVFCEITFLLGRRDAETHLGAAAVGSVLPDLVKPFYLLKTYAGVDLVAFSLPLATPVGALLVALLASRFFPKNKRNTVFGFLSAGVVIHLVWDSLLHPYGGGQVLLFPLSFQQFSWGVIWSDSILPLIFISIVAAMVLIIRYLPGRKYPSHGPKGL